LNRVGAALDHAPPLKVAEEERLVSVLVVVRQNHRAADVEAKHVIAQFRCRCACRVDEIVHRVQVVVAEEFPRTAVEILGAGLEGQAEGRAGIESVLSGIVRGEHPELGNRVDGRHDVEFSAGAAIVIFPTIHHPDVVVWTLAIETDGEAAALCAGAIEIRHSGGHAWNQFREADQVAAVHGQLRHLLSGNHFANFAGIRLDPGGYSLNGDALFGFPNLQLDIDTSNSTDVQNDVVLLGGPKTRGLGLDTVLADYKAWHGVLACVIADDVANSGGFVVRDGDLYAGNGCPRWICNRSDDGCLLRCGVEREG